MMKKIAILLAAVMLLSIPTVGLAAESGLAEETVVTTETETLLETEATEEAETAAEDTSVTEVPAAGITPDSWLYGLDNFIKDLRLLITFDAAEKAGLLDEISGERLAEAREMVEANKAEYGLIAMKAYKAALEKTIEVLDDAILNEKDIESVLDQFSGNQIERDKLAAIILEELPEELRAQIEQQLQDAADELEVTIDVTDYDTEDTDTEETSSDDADTAEGEEEAVDEASGDTEEKADEDEESSEEDTEEADKDETEENEVPVLSLKKQVTVEVLKEAVSEAAAEMFAKGELNLRQIMTVSSLAEQTGKSFDEVLAVFMENEKGIGATAKALELHPKDALKGIKGVFKNAKKQIKAGFAEAKNELRTGEIDEDQDEAEDTEKNEPEDTEQETTETDTQTPVVEDSEDDSSEQAEITAVENEEEVKQLVGKNGKKDKTSGSGKDDKKNAKSSDEDENDDDDDADEAAGPKNNKDNKEVKEKTNQSDNRSDRAKERSNRKQN